MPVLSAHKCTMHMKILLLNLPKYGSVVLGKPINAIVLNKQTRHKNNLFKWRFKWKRSLGTLCIVSVVVMESKKRARNQWNMGYFWKRFWSNTLKLSMSPYRGTNSNSTQTIIIYFMVQKSFYYYSLLLFCFIILLWTGYYEWECWRWKSPNVHS